MSRLACLAVKRTRAGRGRDEGLRLLLAQAVGLVVGKWPSPPPSPVPTPSLPRSVRAVSIPWTWLCSGLDAAAYPPWWDRWRVTQRSEPIPLQKRGRSGPYQRLLNLCDVSAPRDLWPRFQGLSGDDLTSWAVSLTRGRLG